jgi:hypothetical protein
MYEVNKQVAFDDLMEKVMELVDVCGGWDEKTNDYKPGVSAQFRIIEMYLRQALELPTSD